MFVKGRDHWEDKTEALFKEESVSTGHPPLGWLCGTSSDPEVALVLLSLGHELSYQILPFMGSVSRACWWILYLMLNPMFWTSVPHIPLHTSLLWTHLPNLSKAHGPSSKMLHRPEWQPLFNNHDRNHEPHLSPNSYLTLVTLPISSLSELSLDEMFSLHPPHHPATAEPSPYHISPGL